jgi:hypothetical protein
VFGGIPNMAVKKAFEEADIYVLPDPEGYKVIETEFSELMGV